MSTGWGWVPEWGEDDVHVAAWLAELTDEQLQRLAFATLGTLYAHGVVQPTLRFTAPLEGLQIDVVVRQM